jgi:hypothetical protein
MVLGANGQYAGKRWGAEHRESGIAELEKLGNTEPGDSIPCRSVFRYLTASLYELLQVPQEKPNGCAVKQQLGKAVAPRLSVKRNAGLVPISKLPLAQAFLWCTSEPFQAMLCPCRNQNPVKSYPAQNSLAL